MNKLLQTFTILLAVAFLVIPFKSYALTRDQRFEIERRYWYDETDTGCNASSTASNLDLSGNNNIQIAFNFFVSQGLTTQASASLVGNFQDESSVNPRSDQPDGPGRGIAQWSEGDRWDNLVNWANSQRKDPLALETQLEFVMVELNGDYRSVLDRIKTSTNIPEAVRVIVYDYESPADEPGETADRIPLAQQIYNTYASQAPISPNQPPTDPSNPAPNSAVDPCAGAGKSSDSGVGGIDNFPLNTNKRVIQAGVSGATWCYQNTNNCHGTGEEEYNAADIHVPTGTPVVAAKSGKVATVNNNTSGANLSILGSDGKYVYYYTHMGFGTITVEEGQNVSAGDTIGRVGTSAEAEGAPPHLHFDMLPGRFGTRPVCSRASCPSDVKNSFIDVQPLLVQLYQDLPN